jgi:hypothetical protein
MIVPMIITGHTSHPDKHTIRNWHGSISDVIENVETCKRVNPNTHFYTIYSVDTTISSQKYSDYFDKVLYSVNTEHPYAGEKVKVETGLNYIMSEKIGEWRCFVKMISRTVLNNIDHYFSMMDDYDYIGKNHQTPIQYSTAMFIGNRKLADVWIDCDPKVYMTLGMNNAEWSLLYKNLLLENLFFDCCQKHAVKSLLTNDLCIEIG